MDYQFSFNTRMLVLLCVALILLLGLSVGLGVWIGRAWQADGDDAAHSKLPVKASSVLKAAAGAK